MLLTNEEAKKAIYVDPDFDDEIVRGYVSAASSFLLAETGYDFSNTCEPLAKDFARMFIKDRHFNSNGNYNRQHDFSLGIIAILHQLQIKAKELLENEAKNDE